MNQKVCSICGTMCGETDAFCPNCGASQFVESDLDQTAVLFSNDSQPVQPTQPTYMPPQPVQPTQPTYMPPQPVQPTQATYMPPQPVQPTQPPVQPYAQQPQQPPVSTVNGYPTSGFGIPQGVSKTEYIKNYLSENLVKKLKEVFIVCLIGAAINFFLSLGTGSYLNILDSVIVAGLGFGIYKGRSFACAIILLAYALFNTIYGLVVVGAVVGWLYLISGIYAVVAFVAINKEYKVYSENNQFHPYG